MNNWKKELLTIPNLLSLFRLVLIPVYMTIFLRAKDTADHFLAAGILAVSCLTDAIDGKIARQFNMISHVGKVLDPLADKATQFALLLSMAIRQPIIWIIVSLFVVKEGFQLIAGLIQLRKGRMLAGALIPGKVCTTVLFVSLILMVLMPNMPAVAITWITVIDCVIMLWSLAAYVRVYATHSPKIQDLNK